MFREPGLRGAAGTATSSRRAISVLVADDHPLVRKGLQCCLSTKERVKIVGEACDGEEAVEKALQLTPDVVLMDIAMPRSSGWDAAQTLRKRAPGIKVLMFSAHTNRDSVLRSIQAGAHGYISKQASTAELLQAIDSVQNGQPFFTPEIAQAALDQMVQTRGQKDPFPDLTARDREVLVLIAEGNSNKEIGNQLGIAVRTVETHRERIMRRLHIHSVAGLTKFAVANGLVPLEKRI